MPRISLPLLLAVLAGSAPAQPAPAVPAPVLFPASGATGVNPDTHLVITFPSAPTLGKSGQIRIYDAADHRLVDTLDLSLPPGPTAAAGRRPAAPPTTVPYPYFPGRKITNANTVPGTPSGTALPTPANAQLTIIGGFSDGFHFYPVIIHGNVATIYPHNNLLDYRHAYAVEIDPGVLTLGDGSFAGAGGPGAWSFRTKDAPPSAEAARLVVAGDGTGDFNTVQGAIDFVPDENPRRVTIFIRSGTYEEIVYFRNKTNVTFLGEDREKVVVGYANNEVFNPHPANVGTNELPGTFPSRRAAFMGDHSSGLVLANFSIRNFIRGQAEGLLLAGGHNLISAMNIKGSGDALQLNDSVYLTDCRIDGDGDTVLTRGPLFFIHCELHSRGAFIWQRNTAASHGSVFVDCRFEPAGDGSPVIARAPTNGGKNYPDAEVVLINCALGKVAPALWGPLGGDTSRMRLLEYHSTNLAYGQPADVSHRHPASRQLADENDAATIASYRTPAYVLGGWIPAP